MQIIKKTRAKLLCFLRDLLILCDNCDLTPVPLFLQCCFHFFQFQEDMPVHRHSVYPVQQLIASKPPAVSCCQHDQSQFHITAPLPFDSSTANIK